MKKTLFTLSLLAALMFCGCNDAFDPGNPPEEPLIRPGGIVDRIFKREDSMPLMLTPSNEEKAYAQMGADFAQKLFGKLCLEAEPNKNVCISPLSLEIALGMLANGVDDEACAELLDSIAGKGVTLDALNAWYLKLRDALESTNNVCLANAAWTQKGYPINRNFINTNKTYYDAEIGHLDFTQTTQAKDSICQWAYYHTYGNIHELNLPITADTRIVAANATWFGAEWAIPFKADSTRKDTFVLSSGEEQTVDMMQNKSYYHYAEASSYRLLSLDYIYRNFNMLIALPLEGYSTNDILPEIDWNQPYDFGQVIVHLPKFQFKTSYELLDPLQELGIRKAMQHPLTRINPELCLQFINQDVSIRIDEKGTEMAATTKWGGWLTASGGNVPPPEPINFFVDHPFVFAVRDNKSHNILFIGKVESIEEN